MSTAQAQKPFSGTLFWRVYTVLPAVYPEHAAQCLAGNLSGEPIYLWFRPPPIAEGFQNLYIGKADDWTLDEKLSLDKVLKVLHQEHGWVFLLSDDTHERHRPGRMDTSFRMDLPKEPGQTRLTQRTGVTGDPPDVPSPPEPRDVGDASRDTAAIPGPGAGAKEGNTSSSGRRAPRASGGWRRWLCVAP